VAHLVMIIVIYANTQCCHNLKYNLVRYNLLLSTITIWNVSRHFLGTILWSWIIEESSAISIYRANVTLSWICRRISAPNDKRSAI